MNELSTTDQTNKAQELIRAAAMSLNQPERMGELAQICGTDETVIAQILTDPSTLPLAMKELARLRRSGELLAEMAAPALEKFLRRSELAMDDPDLPMTTLAKVADTTLKLSGLAEARSVASRQASVAPTSFMSLHVVNAGDPEPPPAQPGELRLTIVAPRAPAEKTASGRVIEQEVVSEQ
jgi:hypothetical protein